MEFMEFFTIDVWTVIFTWVNMIILYNILKKFLYKPVMNVLERREAEIKKSYDDAAVVQERADRMEKEYSEKMAKSREEAGEIIRRATVSAQRREAEIIREANKQVDIMTQRARNEIERERKKAYRDIREEISDISVAIAGKMVQREITAADHEALIAQFIENVGEN